MRKSHRKAPSLSVVTYAFVSISAAVVGVLFLLLMRERLEVYQHETLASAIATRAKGVQTGLARALFDELSNMRHVAERLGSDEPQDMAFKLKMVVGDGSRISWGAFAGIDGRIQASSNGLLVGEDASERGWFKGGLKGPYAGEVREDVTLPSGQGASPRFISLSMPVRGSAGEIRGVLDLRLNFEWPKDYLSDMADALDIDVFLLSTKGEIIIASDGGSYGALDLPSVRAAQTGATATNLERWPDGRLYFTTTLPEIVYRDVPTFGWSLIARIPADTLLAPDENLSDQMIFYLASFGLMLLLLTLIFVESYIRPFGTLARSAQKIADGMDIYPEDTNRTRELQMISAALARLQTRLHSRH
ncbi:MAG: cache domain-containing protein [Allorhizobium sp.]